jgi:hypothetical protein
MAAGTKPATLRPRLNLLTIMRMTAETTIQKMMLRIGPI